MFRDTRTIVILISAISLPLVSTGCSEAKFGGGTNLSKSVNRSAQEGDQNAVKGGETAEINALANNDNNDNEDNNDGIEGNNNGLNVSENSAISCLSGKQSIFSTRALHRSTFTAESANAACQEAATTAGLPGNYIALVTVDDGPNPIDMTDIPGTLYNTNCEAVASNKADFWDGSLNAQINYDEYGQSVGARYAWTGFTEFGINVPKGAPACKNIAFDYGPAWNNANFYHSCKRTGYSSSTCNNRTSIANTGVGVMKGRVDNVDSRAFWGIVTTSCDNQFSFYCIRKVP